MNTTINTNKGAETSAKTALRYSTAILDAPWPTGQRGTLGLETVPGMESVGARDRRRGQDGRNAEIALLTRGGANADRLVRQAHVLGVTVRVRVDGH